VGKIIVPVQPQWVRREAIQTLNRRERNLKIMSRKGFNRVILAPRVRKRFGSAPQEICQITATAG
jgi:hypothetical protein